jgi:hypothetical protein
MAKVNIEAELEKLESMDLEALRHQWRVRMNSDPPKVSAGLLRLALAYELQAKAMGGLSSASDKVLASYAPGKTAAKPVPRLPAARPGMRLVRVWNDIAHVVTVSDDGTIEWNGRTWRSLSVVARAITGTQWSGPKFFGLRDRKVAA